MNIIRKSAGTMLLLSALAGCAGDDGAAPESTPPSPGQSPTKTIGSASPIKTGTEGDSKGVGKMEPTNAAPDAGKKADDVPKLEPPSKADAAKPTGAAAKLSAEELAAVKELPQDEQEAAIAQAVCPVSDEHLGSMEKPVRVTAEGRTFYLCCKGCEKDLKADPKAVLAKLDKLKAGK
jgi:hypothetical protein